MDGKLFCYDCGGVMYCHRRNNGKKKAQFVCSNYGKQPVGTKCSSGHRTDADAVIEILRDTLRYLKTRIEDDPEMFIEQITQNEDVNKSSEIMRETERLKVCKKREDELERLICKIYEDYALEKMPESRYETLMGQYSKEQISLQEEVGRIEDKLNEIEENRKSGKKFINLMARYNDFDEITVFMVNEFVERIMVHDRARKGSSQTTQKIDIYFNFIGNYDLPERDLTEQEKEELARIEAIKDKRHQQYLARKERGAQQLWEKSYKLRRKARVERLKEQNTNTYGITAEEYYQEHYARNSVVLPNP